jgi:hypothetical protein
VQRIDELLTDLFAEVLDEHGRVAPGLRNIVVEYKRHGPRCAAVFSNGHRAYVDVPDYDLWVFCYCYLLDSVDSLHWALTSFGRTVYAQMVECRGIEINDAGRDLPRRPWTERLRLVIEDWLYERSYRRRLIQNERSRVAAGIEARERGIQLLVKNLSPGQRAQYEREGYFEVTGGQTEKRYRIETYMVKEIGTNGKFTRSLCFVPKGGLVAGDVMLAQKLALELFESDALAVANVSTARTPPINMLP